MVAAAFGDAGTEVGVATAGDGGAVLAPLVIRITAMADPARMRL
jgi:hypothetical protein